MQISAVELSLLLDGRLEGDPDVMVEKPAKIEDGQAGSVSFIANSKYEEYAYTTKASVLIVGDDLVLEKEISPTLIRVSDPYSSFTVILNRFNSTQESKTGIEEPSHIDPSAKVGKDAYIGAFSYVDADCKIGNKVQIHPNVFLGRNVRIGDNTVIHTGVRVYEDCVLGNDCVIHSGVVIGSDGFGFAPNENGTYEKIPQMGNVVLEDKVEIGSNTTIDRATVGSTVIGKGVKLDNLIQIAHNVEIEENTVIAAQTGVSGSTKIGKNSMIGGQVGFVGHIKIAAGSKIQAQSGIGKDIENPNTAWAGSPAFDYAEALKSQVVFQRLPELEKKIRELESQLESLLKDK